MVGAKDDSPVRNRTWTKTPTHIPHGNDKDDLKGKKSNPFSKALKRRVTISLSLQSILAVGFCTFLGFYVYTKQKQLDDPLTRVNDPLPKKTVRANREAQNADSDHGQCT